jgi:hypothetical protein
MAQSENLVMEVVKGLDGFIRPEISGDAEPLANVTTTDKRV